MNGIDDSQRARLRDAFLKGMSIRAGATYASVAKQTAQTYYHRFRDNLFKRDEWDGLQSTGLSFGQARMALYLGRRVKRSDWETWVIGPWDPTIYGLWEPNDPPEDEQRRMWFAYPEEFHAGEIGSEYEDDSYIPTVTDMLANDWEIG